MVGACIRASQLAGACSCCRRHCKQLWDTVVIIYPRRLCVDGCGCAFRVIAPPFRGRVTGFTFADGSLRLCCFWQYGVVVLALFGGGVLLRQYFPDDGSIGLGFGPFQGPQPQPRVASQTGPSPPSPSSPPSGQ